MPPPLPPPSPPPAPPQPPAPPPPPASQGNRTAVTVLCLLLGLFLIIGGCVATCTYFVGKKARKFSEEARQHPQYAALSAYALIDPNIQVIGKDPAKGRMTLRNKQTGEVVTINADDFSADTISQALQKFAAGQGLASAGAAPNPPAAGGYGSGPAAVPAAAPTPAPISAGKAAALSSTLQKFPDYVSPYPNGRTTEASVHGFGNAFLGTYQFDSGDTADVISGHYQKELTSNGFTIVSRNSGSNDSGSTASFVANRASPPCNFTLSAETQSDGKVHVNVAFTTIKP